MTINKLFLIITASAALTRLAPAARGVEFQVINNGNFEATPVPYSAAQEFEFWTGTSGSVSLLAPDAITGTSSALITPNSGTIYQTIPYEGNWQSAWDLELDFACGNPVGSSARSFSMNLYHTTTVLGSNPNINMRVIQNTSNPNLGDLEVYNASAWADILPGAVTFSPSRTSLNVNHLSIIGNYYNTNAPNYSVQVVNASQVVSSATDLTDWQSTAPAANNTNGQLYCINLGSGNMVSTNWYVVDNITLTVSNLQATAAFVESQPAPASSTVYAGYLGNVTLTAQAGGTPPLLTQWLLNGAVIPNATNATLAVTNFGALGAQIYSFSVSNFIATVISSNATITVSNAFKTAEMTNLWSVWALSAPYLTNAYYERGMAYDGLTTNLLLASRFQYPTDNIVVLDAASGNFKYFMNLGGVVPQDVAGSTLGVSQVGVADDGFVYGASVTVNAGSDSTPYCLYQWTDDGSNTAPTEIFSGDPGYGTGAAGERWGDNLAVCGAGPATEILAAPYGDTNVVVFTTPDGYNFNPEIISISGMSSTFAQSSVAFGPGTNTFWAKAIDEDLYLIQFDMNSSTGAVICAYGVSHGVPSELRNVGADKSGMWLAGVASDVPDNVELFNVSNVTNSGPVLVDQELFTMATNANSQVVAGPVGAVAFGTNQLFVLDGNNGLFAYQINASLAPFPITGVAIQSGGHVVLTWTSVAGHVYQVQSNTTLSNTGWSNVGAPVTATGVITSVTTGVSGTPQFYRIQGQ